MFKKLDISISNLDLNKLKGPLLNDFGAVSEYEIKNYEYFYNNVTAKIKFLIEPTDTIITKIIYPGSKPHKDWWSVVLNYYFNASGDVTYWWKQTQNFVEDDPNAPTVYNFSNLLQTDSFVAKTGDMYLLDTKIVHSIKINDPNEQRYLLKFGWINHSFEEILNSIIPL